MLKKIKIKTEDNMKHIIKKIIKDNKEEIENSIGIGQSDNLDYEITLDNQAIFLDNGDMNGNLRSICIFISHKLAEETDNNYLVFHKFDKFYETDSYKIKQVSKDFMEDK
tara:strand:- start:249 stop:578 length:330 start_codon:yes stop_codon:yes gene_type:complete